MNPISFAADLWVENRPTFWWLAFIGTVFLVGLLLAVIPVALRVRALRKARVACAEAVRHGTGNAARAQVGALLEADPHLRPGYKRFERWWRGALVPSKGVAVGARELEDFIEPGDLASPGLRAGAGVLPGVLVALGILGTFVGLVAGLPAVGDPSSIATNANGFRDFVSTITKSLGLAFYTSIFGIAGSVLFLFADKTAVAYLERRVQLLSDTVADAFPTLSGDELQRVQLEMVEDGVASLKNVGTDLAQSLANYMGPAMSAALHAELAPAVASIQAAVERLVTFSTDQQVAGVEAMANKFVSAMNDSMGDQFARLREVISQTVEAQETIGQSIQAFTVQLRSTAQSQGELVDRTTRLARALSGTVEKFEQIASALSSSSEGFGELAASLADAAGNVVSRSEEATAVQLKMAESLEVQRVSLDKAREDLTSSWEQAVSRAQGAIHQITESARQVGEGVGDQLVGALQTFDHALAEAVQRFSGTLAEMNATVGELPGVTNAISTAVSGMHERAEAFQAAVTSLDRLVSEQLTDYGRDTSAAAAHLRGVVELANRAAVSASTSGSGLTDAVNSLSGTIGGFGRRLDDLQTATDALLKIGLNNKGVSAGAQTSTEEVPS